MRFQSLASMIFTSLSCIVPLIKFSISVGSYSSPVSPDLIILVTKASRIFWNPHVGSSWFSSSWSGESCYSSACYLKLKCSATLSLNFIASRKHIMASRSRLLLVPDMACLLELVEYPIYRSKYCAHKDIVDMWSYIFWLNYKFSWSKLYILLVRYCSRLSNRIDLSVWSFFSFLNLFISKQCIGELYAIWLTVAVWISVLVLLNRVSSLNKLLSFRLFK